VPYRKYIHYLKYLGLTLLAYLFTALIIKQDWQLTLQNSFLPTISFEPKFILNMVAFFGTTISPYLFFWQTYEEVEEQISHHHAKTLNPTLPDNARTLQHMRLDTIFGMFYASLIAYFIIVTTASTLHLNQLTDIQTASQAAEALRPLAGNFTYLLFAIGIVGAGLLGIPVLAASASYAFSEAFGFKLGLCHKFKDARKFYLVIALAVIFGLFINLLPIPPFKMLYYAAVINGLVAPVLMIIILKIANDKQVLGQHTNSPLSNFLGVIITLIMGGCGLLLLYDLFL
jgi:Mn2+/Fe2+ NRAMP family transporter